MNGKHLYTAILVLSLLLVGASQALGQSGSLVGTVRDFAGKPRAKVMIVAVSPDGSEIAQTDENGKYGLRDLKEGTYTAAAIEGLGTGMSAGRADAHYVRIQRDKETQLDIVVGGPLKIYGEVTLKGEPQEGLAVALQYSPETIMATKTSRTASDRTDKSGLYEIEGVPPGRYMLSVVKYVYGTMQHRTFFEAEIELANTDIQKNIGLPEGKILGRVVDAETGEPIEDARVTLERKQAKNAQEAAYAKLGFHMGESTDAEGEYSFSIVEDDVYYLVASKQGFAPQGLTATVKNSKGPTDLDFSLGMGETLCGRVTWSDPSRPVKEIFLTAKDSAGRGVYMKKLSLSEGGEYETEELSPGEYAISVDAWEYASASKNVKVRAGAENRADFVLTAGGTLLIKAIDEKGNPVRGAYVELMDERGNFFLGFFPDVRKLMSLSFEEILGEDGVSISRNLPEGKYVVKVGALGYNDESVTVSVREAEQTEKTVTLSKSK